MSYNSAYSGTQIDASVALSQTNKNSIVTLFAAVEALGISQILLGEMLVDATFSPAVTQDFTATGITGAAVGDPVFVYSGLAAGWPQTIGGENPLQCQGGWVSAANTVKTRWYLPVSVGDQAFSFTIKFLVLKLT